MSILLNYTKLQETYAPSEHIRNDDDDALGVTSRWIGDVGRESM